MKKQLLLIASMAMLGLAAGCEKEKEEPTPPEPVVEKSTKCMLLEFSIKNEYTQIKGSVYEMDKAVELVYLPGNLEQLAQCEATYKISEKATISPDPATVKNYTTPQKFTVTAEDGKSKAEYTVTPKEARMEISFKPVGGPMKLQDIIGASIPIEIEGNRLAFCAADRLAFPNMEAVTLDGKKKEAINVTGIPANYAVTGMGNDENGYLVVNFGFSNENYGGPVPKTITEVKSFQIWIWKDGYTAAPTKLYEKSGWLGAFMTVGGNFKKSMICAGKPNLNRQSFSGKSHLWVWENGDPQVVSSKWCWFLGDPKEWEKVYTTETSGGKSIAGSDYWVDGCGATPGEMINAIDGTVDGKFIWACADLMSIRKDDGVTPSAGGGIVYVRDGAKKDETTYNVENDNMHLNGNLFEAGIVTKKRYGGSYGYGNIDWLPEIKGFKYNGEYFAAVTSTGWQDAYFTVINISKSTKGKTEYLLGSQSIGGGTTVLGATPTTGSVAYVYDPKTDIGHLAVTRMSSNDAGIGLLYLYEITRKAM